MRMNDHIFNWAGTNIDSDKGFTLVRQPNRLYYSEKGWHNIISIEMSLDQKDYYRRVYSILDFFSDVGGLFGALSPIFMSILAVLNFHGSYQFLMDDLFVTTSKKFGWWSKQLEQNNVQWRPCKSMCLSLVSLLGGNRNRFCRYRDRRNMLRTEALKHILKESSIANIIR